MTNQQLTTFGLTSSQLATLKRTIAKDLNDLEFDLFMEACRSYKLDPFRKQIIPAIYNADKPDKRRMTLITTRDGLRVIASRQGDYRPASEPPVFTYFPEDYKPPQGAPQNPLRIESVTVKLWKKDGGEWFPVVGQVYWDEYCPTGGTYTYGQWPKMPRVMIAKCAEAAALRAGWPDAFAGLYVAEELDAGFADQSASEALERAEKDRRMKLVGTGITFDIDGTRLEKIAVGEVFDKINAALSEMTDEEVLHFRNRNETGLREFWAQSGSDALELKKIMEPRIQRALAQPAEESQ